MSLFKLMMKAPPFETQADASPKDEAFVYGNPSRDYLILRSPHASSHGGVSQGEDGS